MHDGEAKHTQRGMFAHFCMILIEYCMAGKDYQIREAALLCICTHTHTFIDICTYVYFFIGFCQFVKYIYIYICV